MSSTAGVYRRGKTWWIRYSVGGDQIRRSAETTRKAEAEALLSKIKAEIFSGAHFPEKRRAGLTVADLGVKWLERSSRKRDLVHDKQRWQRIDLFFGPDRLVTSIMTEDVIEFRDQLAREDVRRSVKPGTKPKPMSAATVNRHLALLRSALRYAERSLRQQTRKPMVGVDMLPELNARDRIASSDEYARLIAAASPKLRLAIVFGYWTAMRLGEIVSLRWEQVDMKAGVASLKATNTKTHKAREVPLPPAVIDALKRETRPIDGGPIFAMEKTDATGKVTREPMKPTSMSPLFAKLVSKLEIDNLRFHDLRHSRATALRRSGADVFTIAAITGHKDLASLRRYQTITTADLVAAAQKAADMDGAK